MLTIYNHNYLAIYKLISRADPLKLSTMESYTPSQDRDRRNPLTINDFRRVARRRKTLVLEFPCPYEIHLATDTHSGAMEMTHDPNFQIASFFSVRGECREQLNRRSNCGWVLHDSPDGQETLYRILTWRDVMYDPMHEKEYTGHEQTKRKLERCRYPRDKFNRIEGGRKVYYLDKATDREYKLIMAAFKCVEN